MSNPFKPEGEDEVVGKDNFDYEKHLRETKEEVLKYAGQPGCNPYIWLRDNFNPLAARWLDGERTDELKSAIKKLKAEKPLIGLVSKQV